MLDLAMAKFKRSCVQEGSCQLENNLELGSVGGQLVSRKLPFLKAIKRA